jgi:hypothetical protein
MQFSLDRIPQIVIVSSPNTTPQKEKNMGRESEEK